MNEGRLSGLRIGHQIHNREHNYLVSYVPVFANASFQTLLLCLGWWPHPNLYHLGMNGTGNMS